MIAASSRGASQRKPFTCNVSWLIFRDQTLRACNCSIVGPKTLIVLIIKVSILRGAVADGGHPADQA